MIRKNCSCQSVNGPIGDNFGPGGHLENCCRNPEIELVQALHPQIMYARGEYDTKRFVVARVLTVQLATILDHVSILKIGVETLKSNLSKLYTPKSCMQEENMIQKTDTHTRAWTHGCTDTRKDMTKSIRLPPERGRHNNHVVRFATPTPKSGQNCMQLA